MPTVTRGSLQAELEDIARDVVVLAAHVTEAIPAAIEALLSGDRAAAQAVIERDGVLDERAVEVEERCYRTLATQQPVASDLRAIVAGIRMVAEIERSGDLVVNVCKTARDLHSLELPPAIRGALAEMGDLAADLFRRSMDAYADGDAVLAAQLERLDDELDAVHADYQETVLAWGEAGSVRPALQMAVTGRHLERIGDHAVNIGHRVRYLVHGELRTEVVPG